MNENLPLFTCVTAAEIASPCSHRYPHMAFLCGARTSAHAIDWQHAHTVSFTPSELSILGKEVLSKVPTFDSL
jgi:hypothetical protein